MRVIVLGDMHYTDYDNPFAMAARERFFEGFFRQVAAQQADLVIAIGDTVTTGTLAELTALDALLRRVGLDLLRIPGNHDSYTLDKSELFPFFLGGRAPASSTDIYTGFDAGPVRFLLLDTTRSKDPNWSGFVSDEQLAWLDAQIEDFNRRDYPRYLIAMGHHPIYNTTRRSDELWLNIDNSDEVRPIFNKLARPPAFYVCGHNHVNSLAGPDQRGWYYVQPGAPLVCRSYGLFTIDAAIRYDTVDIDLSDPQMRADLDTTRFALGENFNEMPFDYLYGSDEDRHLKVATGK